MPYNPYQPFPNYGYPNNFTYGSTGSFGQQDNLMKVNGFKSVEEYPLGPNRTQAFFHAEENIFWIKETDASGNPRYRKFTYQEAAADSTEYVTRQEFNALRELILNGCVPVQNKPDTDTE